MTRNNFTVYNRVKLYSIDCNRILFTHCCYACIANKTVPFHYHCASYGCFFLVLLALPLYNYHCCCQHYHYSSSYVKPVMPLPHLLSPLLSLTGFHSNVYCLCMPSCLISSPLSIICIVSLLPSYFLAPSFTSSSSFDILFSILAWWVEEDRLCCGGFY